MTGRSRGLCITVAGVLCLSPDGLLIRLISTDQWTLVFWRGAFMAAGLLAFILLRNRNEAGAVLRAAGRPGLLAGAIFALSTVFFVTSILTTAVANTLVILSAGPLFAAFFSRWILGEAIELRTWVASIAVFAGLATIFGGSMRGGTLPGDLCALGSALCMAAYLVIVRRAGSLDMLPAAALGGILAAIAVLPLAAPFSIGLRDLALLALLGLFVQGASFGMITVGARHLPAPEVGLIMLLEAVLGPLWVWLAIGEVPSSQTFLGGSAILVSLAAHSAAGLVRSRSARTCL